MIAKRILCLEKLRKTPRQFSWLDHRLVRKGYIGRCSHKALALYLFLVTVADAEGLSYYSDSTAGGLLNMDAAMLAAARLELCRAGLVAYQYPLYQVLALDEPPLRSPVSSHSQSARKKGEAVSIGEVLCQMAGGAQ